MFKIAQNPEFTHDVPIQVPSDKGHDEQMLSTRFRVLDLDEMDAFDLTNREGTTDFLRRVIVEFHDLVDDKKKPVEYTDAVRDQLLAVPYIRMGLTAHYTRAVYKARAGN